MSAEKGDILLPFSIETATKQLLDKKMYVENYSDLITYTTDRFLFKMPVFCAGLDDSSKTGWWLLIDPLNPQLYISWQQISVPAPNNQILQLGSSDYNDLTYELTLGATTDWVFIEEGVTFTRGSTVVNLTAPHATFPRADIVVWDSVNEYVVIEGTPAADFIIPNTPVGAILVETRIRNVDGSTTPIPPPNLSGYAKLIGDNLYSGNQTIKDGRLKIGNYLGQSQFTFLYPDDVTQLGYFTTSVNPVDGNARMAIGLGNSSGSTLPVMYTDWSRNILFYGRVKGLDPVDAQDFVTKSFGSNNYVDLTTAEQIISVVKRFQANQYFFASYHRSLRTLRRDTDDDLFYIQDSNNSDRNIIFIIKPDNSSSIITAEVNRVTGVWDFKFRPTLLGSELALKSEVDTKLDASAYNDRFKGKYTTLLALQTAFPTASAGDYAQVDAGAGSDVINYNYDIEDGWIEGGSGSAATNTDALPEGATNLYFTDARAIAAVDISGKVDKIAGKGLSEADFTTIEKTKLSGIATAATANTKATSAEVITGTDDENFVTPKGRKDWWEDEKTNYLGIYVTSGNVITALGAATYTNNRATITPAGGGIMYQGQIYDNGTYTYMAISNNIVRRW